MEKLNKDEIVTIALLLDLLDILKFCQTSKKIDRYVCKNDDFWTSRLKKDFNFIFSKIHKQRRPKLYYKILYSKFHEGFESAVKNNFEDLVDFYIDKASNFSRRKQIDMVENGLLIAAENGNKNLVRFFISLGAKNFDTALHRAIQAGHPDIFNFT